MMDRNTAQAFRTDFDAAMATLTAKYGVTIDLGKMYLYPDKVTAKIIVEKPAKAMDLGTDLIDAAKTAMNTGDFTKLTVMADITQSGIPAEYAKVIGMECLANRGTLHLKVVGYNPRAKRDFIKLEGANGRTYKASLNWVTSHLIPAHKAKLLAS